MFMLTIRRQNCQNVKFDPNIIPEGVPTQKETDYKEPVVDPAKPSSRLITTTTTPMRLVAGYHILANHRPQVMRFIIPKMA